MMTNYVKMPQMGASILSDGVDRPFSVRPAADDDLQCKVVIVSSQKVIISITE